MFSRVFHLCTLVALLIAAASVAPADDGALTGMKHFVDAKADLKMGDTPSVARLLRGVSDDPSAAGWGGSFVRAWERPHSRFDRLSAQADRMEVFGILELDLPLGDDAPAKPEAQLVVENQKLAGHVIDGKFMRFRFCPKAAKTFKFAIRSNVPALDGQTGGITAVSPAPKFALQPSAKFPNWWTDSLSPELAEGSHSGAKSVSRWRVDFLDDFAKRMDRCISNPN